MWNAPLPNTGFKKKLYKLNPDPPPATVEVQQTKRDKRTVTITPRINERGVRQILADKLSGTHLGMFLLIPEYQRLGGWDLLVGTFGEDPALGELAPRMGLQLAGEAALCVPRLRKKGSLCNQGFALAAGSAGLASDTAVHAMLDEHTVADYQSLQIALQRLRELAGHYQGEHVLAIDPHRIPSATGRRMPKKKKRPEAPSRKMMQLFFCGDLFTGQPLGFTIASSGTSCSKATIQLVEQLRQGGLEQGVLVADKEHFTAEIGAYITGQPGLDILMPAVHNKRITTRFDQLPYTRLWAGYAVAETPFTFTSARQTYRLLVQRTAERPEEYAYKAFLTTSQLPAKQLLTYYYPKRWTIEEFFNFEGDMGWNRAATFNLNVRYGKQSLGLLAQAATYQLKTRLPAPYNRWTAPHLAGQVLTNMEGDIRVKDDTIVVTYYRDHEKLNLKEHYQHLPQRLEREGICPKIPWLYDFKLDFRFR